jgi:hypothetical protein
MPRIVRNVNIDGADDLRQMGNFRRNEFPFGGFLDRSAQEAIALYFFSYLYLGVQRMSKMAWLTLGKLC